MDRATLGRALISAAAQTWENLEIIVVAVSGGSHRQVPDSYEGRPLRFVIPDVPLDRARSANACLDVAQGEWLNLLDDDDELSPHHVETLLDDPRPVRSRVIYSQARVCEMDGTRRGVCGFAGFHAQYYFQNRTAPVAAAFHRSLIKEGARFRPHFPKFEGEDFSISCPGPTDSRFVEKETCVRHAY
ncbi:MAG: glycosyltransferase family A protein [Rhodanobacteraceae bacterium]